MDHVEAFGVKSASVGERLTSKKMSVLFKSKVASLFLDAIYHGDIFEHFSALWQI